MVRRGIKEWLGYDRRERRAVFLLALLIIVILTVRALVPEERESPVVTAVEERLAEAASQKEEVTQSFSAGQPEPYRSYPVSEREERSPLELNSIDSLSLTALPGIGPVLSSRIVRFRDLLGGFAAVEQLREVYGLPEETYLRISGMVTADRDLIEKIDINSAPFGELLRHPYIVRDDVVSILNFRENRGSISDWETIKENGLLDNSDNELLVYYIGFGSGG